MEQEQEHGSMIVDLPISDRRMPKGEPRQFKSTTHEERFLHVRGLPADSKYSIATVFARKETNPSLLSSDGWYASVAFCWKKDQFSREQGRQNARRLYFRPHAKSRPKPCYLGPDFNYEIAETFVNKVLERMFNH